MVSESTEVSELRHNAHEELFKNKNYELAFSLARKLTDINQPSGFFMCGLILEKGWLNGSPDFDGALGFYRGLAIKFNDDEGYLGCVRVMLEKHEVESRDKAVNYCVDATRGRLKHLAYLLLGRVYEELYNPPDYRLAHKAYLKSFACGSAWALRQYAMSLRKSRNMVGSVFMHVIATIVSPLLVLIGGVRATRHG